jgi:FMN phosphatase YigB (HAD superfamily)
MTAAETRPAGEPAKTPGSPVRPSPQGVKAIVFDLGGVLLRLRDPIDNFELRITEREFLDLWLQSLSVREFERGAIDVRTFAKSVVRELGLPMDWRRFLDRFNAWPQTLFPEALAMLAAIPSGIRRVLLSNTNASHWGREEISGALAGIFDREFLSFRTGFLKPDREAFDQVREACGCELRELLFFDDSPGNIAAARGFGLQAYLSRGPAEARRILAGL